jgi:type III pantothenate kinase
MTVEMDNPDEVGADRLVNSVAAMTKYGKPVISVDLGTAITFDVVSADGAYIGGAIAPGLAVSMETLFSRTARLPQIALTPPERFIGKNTMSAVQSGIVKGYTGLADAIVEGIFAELGTRTPVIATGGHAEILAGQSKTITHVEPWLTLDGLLILYKRRAK